MFSGDYYKEYESIWDKEKDSLMKILKYRVGHTLTLKDSTIDHHGMSYKYVYMSDLDAGRGVFLECPSRSPVILPGTLLGLFPGVVCDPFVVMPETPKRGVRPYLKRFDGYWLDYEKELPYPMPSPGTSFCEFFEEYDRTNEVI